MDNHSSQNQSLDLSELFGSNLHGSALEGPEPSFENVNQTGLNLANLVNSNAVFPTGSLAPQLQTGEVDHTMQFSMLPPIPQVGSVMTPSTAIQAFEQGSNTQTNPISFPSQLERSTLQSGTLGNQTSPFLIPQRAAQRSTIPVFSGSSADLISRLPSLSLQANEARATMNTVPSLDSFEAVLGHLFGPQGPEALAHLSSNLRTGHELANMLKNTLEDETGAFDLDPTGMEADMEAPAPTPAMGSNFNLPKTASIAAETTALAAVQAESAKAKMQGPMQALDQTNVNLLNEELTEAQRIQAETAALAAFQTYLERQGLAYPEEEQVKPKMPKARAQRRAQRKLQIQEPQISSAEASEDEKTAMNTSGDKTLLSDLAWTSQTPKEKDFRALYIFSEDKQYYYRPAELFYFQKSFKQTLEAYSVSAPLQKLWNQIASYPVSYGKKPYSQLSFDNFSNDSWYLYYLKKQFERFEFYYHPRIPVTKFAKDYWEDRAGEPFHNPFIKEFKTTINRFVATKKQFKSNALNPHTGDSQNAHLFANTVNQLHHLVERAENQEEFQKATKLYLEYYRRNSHQISVDLWHTVSFETLLDEFKQLPVAGNTHVTYGLTAAFREVEEYLQTLLSEANLTNALSFKYGYNPYSHYLTNPDEVSTVLPNFMDNPSSLAKKLMNFKTKNSPLFQGSNFQGSNFTRHHVRLHLRDRLFDLVLGPYSDEQVQSVFTKLASKYHQHIGTKQTLMNLRRSLRKKIETFEKKHPAVLKVLLNSQDAKHVRFKGYRQLKAIYDVNLEYQNRPCFTSALEEKYQKALEPSHQHYANMIVQSLQNLFPAGIPNEVWPLFENFEGSIWKDALKQAQTTAQRPSLIAQHEGSVKKAKPYLALQAGSSFGGEASGSGLSDTQKYGTAPLAFPSLTGNQTIPQQTQPMSYAQAVLQLSVTPSQGRGREITRQNETRDRQASKALVPSLAPGPGKPPMGSVMLAQTQLGSQTSFPGMILSTFFVLFGLTKLLHRAFSQEKKE